MAFGGKQFHCHMSCDNELANEGEHCGGKNASYITIAFAFFSCQILLEVKKIFEKQPSMVDISIPEVKI